MRKVARMARKTSQQATSEPSLPVWKATAAAALAMLHERAAVAMRERDWPDLYVDSLSPDDPASHAARD
jgi:hypothetical protein